MLSLILDHIDDLEVRKDPLVDQLLKRVYNTNPLGPKYNSTWDVNVAPNQTTT